jgi:exodeoxyribonuclease-5
MPNPVDKCITERAQRFPRRSNLQFMTYAYAITAHRAQGSEWDRVLVIDESHSFDAAAQNWLYTALTRAKQRVTLVTMT